MAVAHPTEILVAGAGIAGLTAALAFAARGFRVRVFERAAELREIGAGLQLSPNATRILDELGVLGLLRPVAVQPEAVVLRSAATFRELARVPLGNRAHARWKAPYLALHRADLQQALLTAAGRQGSIAIVTDAQVADCRPEGGGVTATVTVSSSTETVRGAFLVAADGARSDLRTGFGGGPSRTGAYLAWRRLLPAGDRLARPLSLGNSVGAFLDPRFHMIAYPVRSGSQINLVAFTPAGTEGGEGASADPSMLRRRLARSAPPLAGLADDLAAWSAWPIREVEHRHAWVRDGRMALVGDAAHAMTPFAAQGAAMAIEDAATLADAVATASARITETGADARSFEGNVLLAALTGWEGARKERVGAVRRRGAFNQFVWHAAGPIGMGRDLVLRLRSGESLAADLDWLYGWDRHAATPG